MTENKKTYTVELTREEIFALWKAAYELEELKDHEHKYRAASDAAFKMVSQAGLF